MRHRRVLRRWPLHPQHRLTLALVACAALLGCGGRARRTTINSHCKPIEAPTATTALVWVQGNELVVRRPNGEQRLPLPASCPGEEIDRLYVSSDAGWAIGFGRKAKIAGDLWGHAGHDVVAACRIELATGTDHGLTEAETSLLDDEIEDIRVGGSGRLYSLESEALIVLGPGAAHERFERPMKGWCDLDEAGGAPTLACARDHALTVERFSPGAPMQTAWTRRIELPGFEVGELVVSPDGSRVAMLGEADGKLRLIVVDVLAQKILFEHREPTRLHAERLALDSDGSVVFAATPDNEDFFVRRVAPGWASKPVGIAHPLASLQPWDGRAVWAVGNCTADLLPIPRP